MFFKFAWRYFKAKKSTNVINVIAWVSITAIVVGSASLIIVLSVFNGLEGLVKSLYSSFYTDLKMTPSSGKVMTLTAAQLQKLSSFPGIANYSLVAEDQALLQNGEKRSPMVSLKGVDSNYEKVSGVAAKVVAGKFALGTADEPSAVLGTGIESALGIQADRSILPLSVYLFKRGAGIEISDPMASISTASIAPAGKFAIQEDFDNKYVITNLGFMKRMLGLGEHEFGGAEISLVDGRQAEQVQKELQETFGSNYRVLTRYQQNQGLYSVMETEKWVIYAILTLILIVAAFNMVGALTMLVLEKQKDIQVLKAMGASNRYVQRIFLTEGLLLGLLGGGTGILLALILCGLQIRYRMVPLQGDSFLIDYYPVAFVGSDFVLVFSTILVVALMASWLPSRKAAFQSIDLRS